MAIEILGAVVKQGKQPIIDLGKTSTGVGKLQAGLFLEDASTPTNAYVGVNVGSNRPVGISSQYYASTGTMAIVREAIAVVIQAEDEDWANASNGAPIYASANGKATLVASTFGIAGYLVKDDTTKIITQGYDCNNSNTVVLNAVVIELA